MKLANFGPIQNQKSRLDSNHIYQIGYLVRCMKNILWLLFICIFCISRYLVCIFAFASLLCFYVGTVKQSMSFVMSLSALYFMLL